MKLSDHIRLRNYAKQANGVPQKPKPFTYQPPVERICQSCGDKIVGPCGRCNKSEDQS